MSYKDHAKISQLRYTDPKLSKTGFEFKVDRWFTPVIDPDNLAYYSLFKPFNLSYYLSPRLPIDMGLTDFETIFGKVPNVLRMPIKFPNTEYRIPKEFARLQPFFQRLAGYEAWINEQHDSSFAHMALPNSLFEKRVSVNGTLNIIFFNFSELSVKDSLIQSLKFRMK